MRPVAYLSNELGQRLPAVQVDGSGVGEYELLARVVVVEDVKERGGRCFVIERRRLQIDGLEREPLEDLLERLHLPRIKVLIYKAKQVDNEML